MRTKFCSKRFFWKVRKPEIQPNKDLPPKPRILSLILKVIYLDIWVLVGVVLGVEFVFEVKLSVSPLICSKDRWSAAKNWADPLLWCRNLLGYTCSMIAIQDTRSVRTKNTNIFCINMNAFKGSSGCFALIARYAYSSVLRSESLSGSPLSIV